MVRMDATTQDKTVRLERETLTVTEIFSDNGMEWGSGTLR